MASIQVHTGNNLTGNLPNSIWWGKPWRNTCLEALDGVLYGLLTAGSFGWLWPR